MAKSGKRLEGSKEYHKSKCLGVLSKVASEVSKTDVTFRLFHENLDPKSVTDLLGITPSECRAKGDLKTFKSARKGDRWRTGTWQLESPLPQTASIDEHLRTLLNQLEPRAAEIQGLKRLGYFVDFFCGCFLQNWNEKIVLSPETLGEVASIGAEIDLDIYSDSGETDGEGETN